MTIKEELDKRSGSRCELCNSKSNLLAYDIPKSPNSGLDYSIYLCETCRTQVEDPDIMDGNHWRCLNDSMWNETEAVKVMSWRLLQRLQNQDWTQDLLEMFYLEDDTLKWAKASGDGEEKVIHKDSNGNILQAGDSVVLIKSLDVKGSSLTAKRGTVVRRIALVEGNPEQIEGKVEGQQIVILTKFVKKS